MASTRFLSSIQREPAAERHNQRNDVATVSSQKEKLVPGYCISCRVWDLLMESEICGSDCMIADNRLSWQLYDEQIISLETFSLGSLHPFDLWIQNLHQEDLQHHRSTCSFQNSFICITHTHNHIASVGFTIYREGHPLSLNPRFDWGKFAILRKKKPFNGKGTSGRATEEGSLYQDVQTSNSCMDRTPDTNYNICKVRGSQRTAEQTEASASRAWTTWTPLNRGDLEEGRPHKIISSKTETSVWRGIKFDRNTDIRRAEIQWSPGCDHPDPSIREAAGARRGRWSQGAPGPSEGSLNEKKGRRKEEEEERAIESGQWESDTACSLTKVREMHYYNQNKSFLSGGQCEL